MPRGPPAPSQTRRSLRPSASLRAAYVIPAHRAATAPSDAPASNAGAWRKLVNDLTPSVPAEASLEKRENELESFAADERAEEATTEAVRCGCDLTFWERRQLRLMEGRMGARAAGQTRLGAGSPEDA